jgi:hypothetical protein
MCGGARRVPAARSRSECTPTTEVRATAAPCTLARAAFLLPLTDARAHQWQGAPFWCGVAAGGSQVARLRIVAPGAHTLLNFGRQCVCATHMCARVARSRAPPPCDT